MFVLFFDQLLTPLSRKKGRYRICRKIFSEPDVPPSQKHMSPVPGVTRLHVCAMHVLSRVIHSLRATPSMNISAQSARKPSLMEKRIYPSSSFSPCAEGNSRSRIVYYGKRSKSASTSPLY